MKIGRAHNYVLIPWNIFMTDLNQSVLLNIPSIKIAFLAILFFHA